MRRIIVVVFLLLGLLPSARADSVAAVQELAEQGDTKAQFILGSMYRDGQGVAQDVDAMLRWWGLAAEGGNFDAQFALGNLYSGGFEVAKDNVLAYMWFDILAAHAKDEFIGMIAASNRDALESFMTPADVAKAKQLSTDWQSKHSK